MNNYNHQYNEESVRVPTALFTQYCASFVAEEFAFKLGQTSINSTEYFSRALRQKEKLEKSNTGSNKFYLKLYGEKVAYFKAKVAEANSKLEETFPNVREHEEQPKTVMYLPKETNLIDLFELLKYLDSTLFGFVRYRDELRASGKKGIGKAYLPINLLKSKFMAMLTFDMSIPSHSFGVTPRFEMDWDKIKPIKFDQ